MSVQAEGVREVMPGVWQWECFSPEHKVELTSNAVSAEGVLYIFDPIDLALAARKTFLVDKSALRFVLTNDNHERAVRQWLNAVNAPLWNSAEFDLAGLSANHWPVGVVSWGPWEVFPLPGGAVGEVALRWRERSLVVLGDAVFNLPKYGFNVLPEKYCRDQVKLKQSLMALTEEAFETVLFAHGVPILQGASSKIRELVGK